MTKPMPYDVPMFDEPKAPPRRLLAAPGTPAAPKPSWTRYKPVKPVRCDDCLRAHTEGPAPLARGARWRRKQGATDLLLCYEHAQVRRGLDNLPPLRDDGKTGLR